MKLLLAFVWLLIKILVLAKIVSKELPKDDKHLHVMLTVLKISCFIVMCYQIYQMNQLLSQL